MIKIVKSEKLMASKSNLSIYSIFMSWIIHLALQCGRFYIIKALKKSFFRQISTAFFTLWSWCYMFHHYFDDSFGKCMKMKRESSIWLFLNLHFCLNTEGPRLTRFFGTWKKPWYTKSLVNTNLVDTNFTNTHFQKVPVPHLTRTMKQKFLH